MPHAFHHLISRMVEFACEIRLLRHKVLLIFSVTVWVCALMAICSSPITVYLVGIIEAYISA